MLGAIAGDVIGSTREWAPVSSLDFELFEPHAFPTDDSILTVAVAAWLLGDTELVPAFKDAVRRYPGAGWGGRFHAWGDSDDTEPYGSFGNGAAMRVSPVGFAASSIDEALDLAAQSAAVTHDHPEGIKGAQATALAIFMARNRAGKDEIRAEIQTRFAYDLSRPYDEVRRAHRFSETCQVSVPAAITAFLAASDFEDTIRRAIALGGDADTEASIAGGIAQAFYGGVPGVIREQAISRLDEQMLDVLERFEGKHGAG